MFRTRFLTFFVVAFFCSQALAQVEFPLGSEVVNVRKAPYNAKGDGKKAASKKDEEEDLKRV